MSSTDAVDEFYRELFAVYSGVFSSRVWSELLAACRANARRAATQPAVADGYTNHDYFTVIYTQIVVSCPFYPLWMQFWRNTAMRFTFHAKHTKVHSWPAFFSPRNRNWRNPITDLMMPNTGSTVCLRKP